MRNLIFTRLLHDVSKMTNTTHQIIWIWINNSFLDDPVYFKWPRVNDCIERLFRIFKSQEMILRYLKFWKRKNFISFIPIWLIIWQRNFGQKFIISWFSRSVCIKNIVSKNILTKDIINKSKNIFMLNSTVDYIIIHFANWKFADIKQFLIITVEFFVILMEFWMMMDIVNCFNLKENQENNYLSIFLINFLSICKSKNEGTL